MSVSMENIVNLAKRRGFVFPASEIYGGVSGFWDWGPYGVELKNNLKMAWWKEIVYGHRDIVGLDSAIIQNAKVWEASGHVERFTDPMVDCKSCKNRFRADKLAAIDSSDLKELEKKLHGFACPNCGKKTLTKPRYFNLMLTTKIGPVEDTASVAYLRPETAQGIYINYDAVRETTRQKIPFGIAQIGKAFRNEITPGDFLFRQREFEQMEMQYFVSPKDASKFFESWKKLRLAWHKKFLNPKKLRFREHGKNERAHYAKAAEDIEYEFPFGFKEIEGVHNRGDWDLSRHSEFSGREQVYFDEAKQEKFIPWIVETSAGLDRLVLAVMFDSYHEEEAPTAEGEKEKRVVLKFPKELAPIKVAVLPLSKKPELSKVAIKIWEELSKEFRCEYDETQSIGKRYRRQDEIGTPFCVTVDFDSLKDKAVTIRDRDTMKQKRVPIKDLLEYLKGELG